MFAVHVNYKIDLGGGLWRQMFLWQTMHRRTASKEHVETNWAECPEDNHREPESVVHEAVGKQKHLDRHWCYHPTVVYLDYCDNNVVSVPALGSRQETDNKNKMSRSLEWPSPPSFPLPFPLVAAS